MHLLYRSWYFLKSQKEKETSPMWQMKRKAGDHICTEVHYPGCELLSVSSSELPGVLLFGQHSFQLLKEEEREFTLIIHPQNDQNHKYHFSNSFGSFFSFVNALDLLGPFLPYPASVACLHPKVPSRLLLLIIIWFCKTGFLCVTVM